MNHEDTWVGRHLMDDSGSESKTGIRAPLIFCTSPKPHVTGDPCEHVFAHAISEVGQDIWMSWLPGTFTYRTLLPCTLYTGTVGKVGKV
jgi:hypothetical protein